MSADRLVGMAAGRLSGRRIGRRMCQLYLGEAGYGVSLALMVRARLGLDPWDVFHQGIARRVGVPIGWIVIGVGVLVLLAWIPLRQRPGFGTVSNALLIGLVVNLTLVLVAPPESLAGRIGMLAGGILLNGVSTGCYIGARFGPGPRDGLMTGLAAKGISLRKARTAIELTVLASGFLLGGSVGVGTAAYALSIGPLVHFFLPRLTVGLPDPAQAEDAAGEIGQ